MPLGRAEARPVGSMASSPGGIVVAAMAVTSNPMEPGVAWDGMHADG